MTVTQKLGYCQADIFPGTLASLVAFGINYHAKVQQVPLAVYVVFICLMASAFFVALFAILPPSKIRRSDGTALAHYPHKGFWFEIKAQGQLLRDWRMLALVIPMFASEIAIIVMSTLNGQCARRIPNLTHAKRIF